MSQTQEIPFTLVNEFHRPDGTIEYGVPSSLERSKSGVVRKDASSGFAFLKRQVERNLEAKVMLLGIEARICLQAIEACRLGQKLARNRNWNKAWHDMNHARLECLRSMIEILRDQERLNWGLTKLNGRPILVVETPEGLASWAWKQSEDEIAPKSYDKPFKGPISNGPVVARWFGGFLNQVRANGNKQPARSN